MHHKFKFAVTIFITLCVSNSTPQNCDSKPCISKCCTANSYVYNYECVSNKTLDKDFSDANVYNGDHTRIGSLRDKFQLIYGNFKQIISQTISLSFYILENGNLDLVMQQENSVAKVIKISNDNFCVDYELTSDSFSLIYGIQSEIEPKKNITFVITGLIISSIFLLLVLIIYTLLKELRNLKGKILMAIILSLLSAFVVLVTSNIVYNDDTFQPSNEICYGFTAANYFFFLSSFFWMNLMSFDIWWTLRSMTTRRVIRRHGKWSKFKIYCIYGWGIPLAMTISLIVIDVSEIPESIIRPNILQNGCFLQDKPKFIYLDIPMLLLILSNWIFFLMTAYNYWCCEKDTKVLNSNNSKKHDKHKQSFKVYIKLSVIMGISWITEIISAYVPSLSIWYISDLYNMLIGVSIFYVFVCKPDILKKLSKRFQRHLPTQIPQDTIQSSSV